MVGRSRRQAMVLVTNAPIGRWAPISVEKLAALIEKGFIVKPMRRPEDDLLALLGPMKSSFLGETSNWGPDGLLALLRPMKSPRLIFVVLSSERAICTYWH